MTQWLILDREVYLEFDVLGWEYSSIYHPPQCGLTVRIHVTISMWLLNEEMNPFIPGN